MISDHPFSASAGQENSEEEKQNSSTGCCKCKKQTKKQTNCGVGGMKHADFK